MPQRPSYCSSGPTSRLDRGGQGCLSGSVTFQDDSTLHFSEFLDATVSAVDRLMYIYHYQDVSDNLVFRYDSARHRPPLVATHHKHTPNGAISVLAPGLDDVLAEIASLKGWL